jgi:plasmid replication initiation protein
VVQPLIPLRHPNRDFFVLDITDASPRGDMAGMEFPFFALGTQPDIREREYRRGDVILRVTPSVRGMATVFDRDVLLYCISQLMARKNAGLPIGKVVQFTAHDMLVSTNRQIDGDGYKRLEQALTRLRGTTFQTTIKTAGEAATRIFGMIESADVLRKEPMTGRMVAVEVVLSDFLFRAIEANQVLPIHRDYFRLRSPVDRRLYELARKHCGQQPQWQIGLELLKDKVAFSSNVRLLRAHIRRLVASQHLPDYTVDIADDVVTFRLRPQAAKINARDENEITVDRLDQLIEPKALELARKEARARNRDFYQLKA